MRISYELAKKLKEEGYRFKEKRYRFEAAYNFNDSDGYCVIPTLSELIEACVTNKEEKCIYRLDYDWFERQWEANAGTADEHYESFGKTPEEAVAKLYLELNK